MVELNNPNHEKFARAVVEKPSYSQAYQSVYDISDPKIASNLGSRLMEKADIKERVFQLLRENRADLPAVSRRFADFLHSSEHPAQSWDAVKTGLKIYGVLDEDKGVAGAASVQINIVNLSGDSNSTQP